MRLPDAPWRHWEGMGVLLDALGADEGGARFVGGAVRDALLELDVQDVDIATVHAPEETARRIDAAGLKAVPTGIKHGTVTAVLPGKRTIEVTTLRRDVATDGRHAEVEYTDDWKGDAARRDFTINALSADPVTGEIFDFFGGLDDLAARRVRFIGEPLNRIAEDHLRILRFFRFHARFGEGAPDAESLGACIARANDLMALSRERIADELLKMLALDDPAPTMALMIERGVLQPVLPEIVTAGPLERLIARENLFGHSSFRRNDALNSHPLRRLAALLPPDPETARAIAARLKLSKAQRQRLAIAAARMPGDTATPRALAFRLGIESAVDRLLLCPTNDIVVGRALETLAANPPPERFPLKGADLIALGVEPGPEVSRLLGELREAWIAEDFPGEDRVREMAQAKISGS